MVPDKILKQHHASILSLKKGDTLFHYGERAVSFFIVKKGKIKMSNYSDDGREFIQGYFTDGQSFGEPPFFSEEDYPASAIAVEKSELWKIAHDDFIRLLQDHFDIHLALTKTLSSRLFYKSTMLSELAIEEAEHRLLTLLKYLASRESASVQKIPLTRQQLADMTGLRVETVIRSVKRLEQKHLLEIDGDGKIIWHRHSK